MQIHILNQTNSADPDQLAFSEQLHYFLGQGISGFSRTRVNNNVFVSHQDNIYMPCGSAYFVLKKEIHLIRSDMKFI